MKKLTKKAIFEMIKEDYTILYNPMPESWKEFLPVITVNELSECGFSATTKHTGKMTGMFSFSTTCKCNPSCQYKILAAYKKLGIDLENVKDARKAIKKYIKENPLATNVCICGFCFSDSQQDTFPNMTGKLAKNFEIFNNGIIHDDWIPILNNLYFRGESFGDFNSVNSVINFYKIAAKNPYVNVTAWTKKSRKGGTVSLFFYKLHRRVTPSLGTVFNLIF